MPVEPHPIIIARVITFTEYTVIFHARRALFCNSRTPKSEVMEISFSRRALVVSTGAELGVLRGRMDKWVLKIETSGIGDCYELCDWWIDKYGEIETPPGSEVGSSPFMSICAVVVVMAGK